MENSSLNISIKNVTKKYDEFYALKDISLDITSGEFMTLLGPSGSGKTTLARLLVGFNEPDQGSVRLDGVSIFKWDKSELGPNIGYLPQNIEIFGGTVVENICRFTEPNMKSLQTACSHVGLEDVYNDFSNGVDITYKLD